MPQPRRNGEKLDVTVCAPPEFFANNPQATQLDDGAILCAYYGYSTSQTQGMPDAHGNPTSLNPCGIFVSLFDEQWLAQGEHGIVPG